MLLDGLGDVNVPDLDDMTPLQAAHTPALDALAGKVLRPCLRCEARKKGWGLSSVLTSRGRIEWLIGPS